MTTIIRLLLLLISLCILPNWFVSYHSRLVVVVAADEVVDEVEQDVDVIDGRHEDEVNHVQHNVLEEDEEVAVVGGGGEKPDKEEPQQNEGDVLQSNDNDNSSNNEIDSSNNNNNYDDSIYFLMGLPKSGSLAIHEFIQCMNTKLQFVEGSTTSATDNSNSRSNNDSSNSKHPLSSSHYCCDPNHNNKNRNDSDDTTTSSSSSSFPCPKHMIPCGTCFYNHMKALSLRHEQQQLQQDELNIDIELSSSSDSSLSMSSLYESCGQYNVYTNFHVETVQPFSYFLPQHYTLPYLIYDTYPTKNTNSNQNDATKTSSTKTKWILNHRMSSDIWATNVLHWYSITNRIFNSFNISYYKNDQNNNNNKNDKSSSSSTTTTIKSTTMKSTIHLTKDVSISDLENELDISFERMHDYNDHIRRHTVLQQIYNHHIQKIHEFVNEYNNNNHQQEQLIQLYDINIDDPNVAIQLAKIFGYYSSTNDNDTTNTISTTDTPSITTSMIQSCWTYNSNQLDYDWMDLNMTNTFRVT